MKQHMHLQVLTNAEFLGTFGAAERSDFGMAKLVRLQRARSRESLSAMVAFEWPFAGV